MKVVLSYSKIQTFLECPLKYKYQYIDKLPILPSVHMLFGSALHESIAEFAQHKKLGQQVTHSDLMKTFMDTWNKQYSEGLLKSIEEQEAWIQKGKEYLKAFYRREGFASFKPVHIEKRFNLSLNGNTSLTGIFDRIDYETSNQAVIMEFKTNLNYQRSDLQLKMYSYAFRELYKITPVKSCFSSIETGEKLEYHPTDKDLDEMKPFMIEIANKIRQEHFVATPSSSNCRFCLAKSFCSFKK